MKIKYVRAKNFLSIGEEPIEIDFTKLGNIVNIKGHNYDAGLDSSNASGKTSITQILIYGLFGKLIKRLHHKDVINIKSKGGLEVEVHWDNYRVIRKRSPDRLQLFEDDKEISQGTGTDERIRSIIRLDYDSFVNVSCFGQHNIKPFLSCGSEDKRKIAENLLSLDRYLKYHKAAKEKVKAIKEKTGRVKLLYEKAIQDVTTNNVKYSNVVTQQQFWVANKTREIGAVKDKIADVRKKIASLNRDEDITPYQTAQAELKRVDEEIAVRDRNRLELQAGIAKVDTAVNQKKGERQEAAIELSGCIRELTILDKEIKQLDDNGKQFAEKNGGTCPVCYGKITNDNLVACLEHNLVQIRERQERRAVIFEKKKSLEEKMAGCDAYLQKLTDVRATAREKSDRNFAVLTDLNDRRRNLLSVRVPDSASQLALLQKDLEHQEELCISAQAELDSGGPHTHIIGMLREDIRNAEAQVKIYKSDLAEAEAELPYCEFWVRGFGDDGVRSFVIDEIVPALNARVNYWLQHLMDGCIKVAFDNQLDEKITRVPEDCDPFVYNALSGGEHCRIDLAISQAFAHVMMMTSGTCPSIVTLDEVGANIDRAGIQGLYRMICELARDRQVIVITHDPDLSDLLAGHDVIEVVKKNGITTLKK